jgi:hypothetical protein
LRDELVATKQLPTFFVVIAVVAVVVVVVGYIDPLPPS